MKFYQKNQLAYPKSKATIAKTQHYLESTYKQNCWHTLSRLEPQLNPTKTSIKILKQSESAELNHKSNSIQSSLEMVQWAVKYDQILLCRAYYNWVVWTNSGTLAQQVE